MVLTFQGGRVQRRNKLIYHYACDTSTRIRVTVNGVATVIPYSASAGNLVISASGSGTKLLPPPALVGPPIDFNPFTELQFQNLQDAQLPAPGDVLMITIDGQLQLKSGGGWLPGFAANIANATQVDWFKDAPIGNPHDPT